MLNSHSTMITEVILILFSVNTISYVNLAHYRLRLIYKLSGCWQLASHFLNCKLSPFKTKELYCMDNNSWNILEMSSFGWIDFLRLRITRKIDIHYRKFHGITFCILLHFFQGLEITFLYKIPKVFTCFPWLCTFFIHHCSCSSN